MKTLYRISIFLNCIGMAFVLIKGSELLTKEWIGADSKPAVEQKAQSQTAGNAFGSGTAQNVENEGTGNSADNGGQETQNIDSAAAQQQELQTVNSSIGATTTCDTIYHILICDLTQGTEKETIEEIPGSYMGKNRQQLMDLLDIYNESPPLDEQSRGFQSMELVSFSESDITVRKTYETALYYCCVVVEDDYLTVYDEKRKNVILYTDIRLDALSEQLKQEIIDGKYFKTEQELYHFLESYSS